MNQTVDIGTVVETASSVLTNVSDEDKVLMREWSYLAMMEIGPVGQVNRVTNHRIPVNEFVVFKPIDCAYVEDVAFLDKDLGELGYVLDGKGEALHDHGSATWNYIHVSDNPGYFSLSNNAGNVKWCKMTYLALPVDDKGMPKVPDRAVLAVTTFLRYMWYLRHGEEGIAFEVRKHWLSEKIRATASMKTPDKLNHREFAKGWMSMIDLAMDKVKYQN